MRLSITEGRPSWYRWGCYRVTGTSKMSATTTFSRKGQAKFGLVNLDTPMVEGKEIPRPLLLNWKRVQSPKQWFRGPSISTSRS